MNRQWEECAARSSGLYTPEMFEQAAYRLVAEQALYYADITSRVHYGVIERFEREFAAVLDVFGVDLRVNRGLQYACAISRHQRVGAASKDQTLLALVLRLLYDEGIHAGNMNDAGEIVVDLVELNERYVRETERDFPRRNLDPLMHYMKRCGIVRIAEDERSDSAAASDQQWAVAIRPAIADILGESAILQIALHRPSEVPPTAAGTASTVPANNGEEVVDEPEEA